jgi:hypothetical protein
VTVGTLAANLCNEYLLHGFDVARAVGREWSCPEPAADTTLAVMAPLILTLFNPESAADLTASFAIDSPRTRVCFEVDAGALNIIDTDAPIDCSIAGPSSRLLLWLTRRTGWDDARLKASGTRPNLAAPFGTMLSRL